MLLSLSLFEMKLQSIESNNEQKLEVYELCGASSTPWYYDEKRKKKNLVAVVLLLINVSL